MINKSQRIMVTIVAVLALIAIVVTMLAPTLLDNGVS